MPSSASLIDPAFKRLCANFPNRKFQGREEAEEVKTFLRGLVSEFGEARFTAGVNEAVKYQRDFFPTTAQLREYIIGANVNVGVGQRCRWCENNDGFIIETQPYPNPDKDNPNRTHQVARKCKHG